MHRNMMVDIISLGQTMSSQDLLLDQESLEAIIGS